MSEKSLIKFKGVKMGTNQLQYLGAGLIFLLILLSGYWLSRSGKSYNTIVFTIHKLIALAAVVLLGTTIYRMNRAGTLTAIGWLSAIVTGLFFLGTMATGGALSIDAAMPAAMPTTWPPVVRRLHQVTPYLTVLSTAVTLYLLRGRGM